MNDDAWDDLCVNPHEGAQEQGRDEGYAAGLQKGFEDGQQLGNTKGMEFGMELGFLLGLVNDIERRILPTVDAEKQERGIKSLKELTGMIQAFPNPEVLFRESEEERLDIAACLQRIRAKYKVLTIQLHLPYITLKDVLTEKKSSITTSDW
jgi:hypothetical protein